jgi:hypothetical protein
MGVKRDGYALSATLVRQEVMGIQVPFQPPDREAQAQRVRREATGNSLWYGRNDAESPPCPTCHGAEWLRRVSKRLCQVIFSKPARYGLNDRIFPAAIKMAALGDYGYLTSAASARLKGLGGVDFAVFLLTADIDHRA